MPIPSRPTGIPSVGGSPSTSLPGSSPQVPGWVKKGGQWVFDNAPEIIDTVIGAGSAYQGYQANAQAAALQKEALEMAKGAYKDRQPLRDLGLSRMTGAERPDLSGIFGDSGNPYSRNGHIPSVGTPPVSTAPAGPKPGEGPSTGAPNFPGGEPTIPGSYPWTPTPGGQPRPATQTAPLTPDLRLPGTGTVWQRALDQRRQQPGLTLGNPNVLYNPYGA